MAKGTRRNHSAAFKAKVGLEAIRGVKTVNQIGQEHGVHPVEGPADLEEHDGVEGDEGRADLLLLRRGREDGHGFVGDGQRDSCRRGCRRDD